MVLISEVSMDEEVMIKVRDPSRESKIEDPPSIDDSLVWIDMSGGSEVYSLGISIDTAKDVVIDLVEAIMYLQNKRAKNAN